MRLHPVPKFGRVTALPRRTRRAYSILEVLITVLIIQIISSMILVNVSSVQKTERLSRAADKIVIAARYARMAAMSSGTNTGIEFDTSANTVRVFQGASFTTVTNSLIPGGSYVINFNTDSDLSGVTIASGSIAGDAASPYQVTYGMLGGTINNGYVVISYGGVNKTITIPLVGDPVPQ